MPNPIDDLLNSRIVLFFIGIAFFIKILGSTEDDNSTKHNTHYEKNNDARDLTIQYLLSEIEALKHEKAVLKEQLLHSTRIEKGHE